MQRSIVVVVLTLLIAGACWQALQYRSYVVDDCYISLRYGENLSKGHGLSYNPPQQVEGYSNFLLVLLIAFGYRLGIPSLVVVQVIGLLSLLAIIVVLFAESERVDGPGLGACVAPLLVATSSAMTYWSVAGLETVLYGFLLTASAFACHHRPRATGDRVLAYLSLTALLLCRTEGTAMASLIALHWAWRQTWQREHLSDKLRAAAMVLAPLLVITAAYHGFRFFWFGTLQSAPALVKWRFAIDPFWTGLSYLLRFIVDYAPTISLCALCWLPWRRSAVTIPLLLCAGFQGAVMLLYGGDWMPMYRMIVPLVPLCAHETGRLVRWLARTVPTLRFALAALLVLTGLRLASFPDAQASQIKRQRMLVGLMGTVGRLLRDNVPPTATVAVGDIGNIGYQSSCRILDLKGLVTPWVSEQARVVPEGNHRRVSLAIDDILERARPEVVLVAVHWPPPTAAIDAGAYRGYWSNDTDVLRSSTLRRKYRPVRQVEGGAGLGLAYLIFFRHDIEVSPRLRRPPKRTTSL